MLTPMLLVMVAIGGTDILFALDSIPAIFGLTQSVYIVFTATAFSLLGLRQLYFLIDGLLDRLIYLSYGLAAILAFIGVKLILHALHENNVPFINDGEPVHVAEISTGLSLSVIIGVLIITVVASAGRRQGPRRAGRAPRRRISRQVEDRPRRPRLDTQQDGGGRPSTEGRTSSHHDRPGSRLRRPRLVRAPGPEPRTSRTGEPSVAPGAVERDQHKRIPSGDDMILARGPLDTRAVA